MSTSSPWTAAGGRESTPLGSSTSCDVCVVGGGIAGVTAAYLLADAGKRVVLLEAGPEVGQGESAFTTAHLAWVLDDRFSKLKKARGADVAKAAYESHRDAIELIERLATTENIACDFKRVDGHLFPGVQNETVGIREEEEALKELQIPHERMERTESGGLWNGPALRFTGQGQFHPLKYLAGLMAAVRRKGGVIHTGTRVERIDGGDTCTVSVAGDRTVTAGSVVIATGSPFDAGMVLHTKMAAYNTYAVALEVPAGNVPHALYWDTEDPYHYVRVQPGENGLDLLIVGGEDHKTGQADDQAERWGRLIGWTRQRVPSAGEVKHRWSGQVFETPDGLGLIGRAPWGKNLYVITGDSGMGMTHGTLGARLVSHLILGQADPLAGVYDPNRWMPGALLDLLGEVSNMAAQYADWVTGGDVKSADQIPPGHGAVVRVGLTKHAVFRDKGGKLTELSAVCPHMGGLVRWNPGEQTWDCPCHGSRFTCDGSVMHGPAVSGLAKVEK